MKILLISPVPTHPRFRGNAARILQIEKCLLDQGHEIHLAYCNFEAGDLDEMKKHWGKRLHVYGHYKQPFRKEILRGLNLPIPDRLSRKIAPYAWTFQKVDHYYDEAFDHFLVELQSKQSFEAVITAYVFFSKSLKVFSGEKILKILDTHDIFAGRNVLFRKNGIPPEWFYTSKNEEKRGLLRADTIIAIQDSDRHCLMQRLGKQAKVIEVGHLYEPTSIATGGHRSRIHFMGSNGTLNIQALDWFLGKVWPVVSEQNPTATLHIYGNIQQAYPQNSIQNVEFVGTVETPAEAFEQADVFINPMVFGTGLKIKTIEALAHGLPLVTRKAGVEGLNPEALRNACMVREGSKGFAEAVLQLLESQKLNHALRERARLYHQKYLKTQKEHLLDIFEHAS